MPQINLYIAKKLDDLKKHQLQIEIANSIDVLPGKTKEILSVCIVDGLSIYKNGQPINGAFIDVRIFQDATEEGKRELTSLLFDIASRVLDVPKNQMNINYIELQDWGSAGIYKIAQ